MSRTLGLASLVWGLAVVGAVATGASQAPAGGYPDIIGTWTGPARFPMVDGTVADTPETLVIDKQDGELLWGHVEYPAGGDVQTESVVGTLLHDGHTFVLTEPDGFWNGSVDGDTLSAVISWANGPDDHGAFAAVLARE